MIITWDVQNAGCGGVKLAVQCAKHALASATLVSAPEDTGVLLVQNTIHAHTGRQGLCELVQTAITCTKERNVHLRHGGDDHCKWGLYSSL